MAGRQLTDGRAPGDRWRYARERLSQAQKPANGVPAYTRWVNRRGARVVAAAAYALRLTPNAVTLISAALSFVGMAVLVLAPRTVLTGVVVAVLLAAGYLCDSADGQLARVSRISSRAGEWLDHVVDAFRSPSIHLAVALAALQNSVPVLPLVAVALVYSVVTSGQFLSQILAESLIRRAGRPQTRGGTGRSWILLPTDPGTLCWSFLLWGLPSAFTVVYGLLALIALAHSAASLRRRHRDLVAADEASRKKDASRA